MLTIQFRQMSLLTLPRDLHYFIMMKLSIADVYHLALTCTSFARTFASEKWWKLLYREHYPLHFPYVDNYRLAYKFQTLIPSFDLVYTVSKFIVPFDIEETVDECKCGFYSCAAINLTYPTPLYRVIKGTHGYEMVADILITCQNQKQFTVKMRPRRRNTRPHFFGMTAQPYPI